VPHPPPPPAPAAAGTSSSGWVVQLGSFANRTNAERLAQKVHALGYPVLVSRGTSGQRLYRVQVGPAHDHAAGEQLLSKLRAQGYKGPLVPK
jgi:cell division septation protein DedD